MPAWVVLKHVLPDGSWHWDWMLDVPGRADNRLLTFRIDAATSWPPVAGFDAVQIDPHRREYLTYEGPISGGRGSVVRVDAGEFRLVDISDRAINVELLRPDSGLGQGRLFIAGMADSAGPGGRWRFDLEFP